MPEKIDTQLRTRGLLEGTPTPLHQFATEGLGLRGPTRGELLQERGAITERQATQAEQLAHALKTEKGERAKLSAEQAEARTRERPPALELPATPDLSARPFLSPPQSVLGQLQTALVGIGQLAQGISGLKGKGYAIGATAALKGALEGWQAGDQERAQRAFEKWQADSERLLAAHRARREHYQDILEDHTRSFQDRASQIELDAKIAGAGTLAAAARAGNIDQMLAEMDTQRDYELKLATVLKQVAQWDWTRHVQTEGLRFREESGARAKERLGIYKETAGGILKLQTQDLSLSNKLQTADLVEEAVKIMADRNLLATGPTAPDAWRAWVQRQTAWGDPQVKWAMDTIERQGTALVVGSEIALGEPASAMRLKAVLEPQAGHILTAGPQFWESFFNRYRPFLQAQQKMTREHLRALGRVQAPAEEPGWQVVE